MFTVEDDDEMSEIELMIEEMLYAGNILIEQDCIDLRPLLRFCLTNKSDFYGCIASFTTVYAARETNNWRLFVTEANLDAFYDNQNVEDAARNLCDLTVRVGGNVDLTMADFYSFMAEQYIATYEP